MLSRQGRHIKALALTLSKCVLTGSTAYRAAPASVLCKSCQSSQLLRQFSSNICVRAAPAPQQQTTDISKQIQELQSSQLELQQKLGKVAEKLDEVVRLKSQRKGQDRDSLVALIDQLEQQISSADFWSNVKKAEQTVKRHAKLKEEVEFFDSLAQDLSDQKELLEMVDSDLKGVSSLDTSTAAADTLSQAAEVQRDVHKLCARWSRVLEQKETELLMSGEQDQCDCYLEIHAGAGGTESMDWADMLRRMYERWASSKGFEVNIVEMQAGNVAGIRSCILLIQGENAFGWLKTEHGIHRLVRCSPFDANAKRHTSFASVTVYASIDEEIQIDLNPKDLRIDTMRASGAGGQHVNMTDSAVRITHIPTGIVAYCQNDRSQHANRESAMKVLKSRLYNLELQKRKEQKEQFLSSLSDNSFGYQTRSYVFHPYKLVKDLRTGIEVTQPEEVLDGEHLDLFMKGNLALLSQQQDAQENASAK